MNKTITRKGVARYAQTLTATLALAIALTLFGCEEKKSTTAESGNTFTDSRDGKTYKTVKIGEQVWLAENLNYKPSVGNSRCYEDKEANCDKYGRLYDWETAQTVCPSGWHLSYSKEWDKMFNFVDGADTTVNHNGFRAAAKYFKAKSGWSENGIDKFGFSALPGGFYGIDGDQGGMDSSFVAIGELGIWWSGLEINYVSGFSYESHFQFIDKYPQWSGCSDDNLFSVRCVLGDIDNNKAATAPPPIPVAAESGSGNTFTDSRDGKTYKTVKIGEQVWMAENLNYKTPEGSECYDNKEANCSKYGRMYDWEIAMKACPSGWHLPSKDEWDTLSNFCDSNIEKKLKAANGWNDYEGEPNNGSDDFGFSALPGGSGYSGGSFGGVGDYGSWWSASKHDSGGAYHRGMGYSDEEAYYADNDEKSLQNVRCLKN